MAIYASILRCFWPLLAGSHSENNSVNIPQQLQYVPATVAQHQHHTKPSSTTISPTHPPSQIHNHPLRTKFIQR